MCNKIVVCQHYSLSFQNTNILFPHSHARVRACFPVPKCVCLILIYVQFIVEWLWWPFSTSNFCMRFQHVSDLQVAWYQSFWIESDWVSIIWNYLPVWLIGTQICLWWFVTQHYCGNRALTYSTFKEMSTIQNRK